MLRIPKMLIDALLYSDEDIFVGGVMMKYADFHITKYTVQALYNFSKRCQYDRYMVVTQDSFAKKSDWSWTTPNLESCTLKDVIKAYEAYDDVDRLEYKEKIIVFIDEIGDMGLHLEEDWVKVLEIIRNEKNYPIRFVIGCAQPRAELYKPLEKLFDVIYYTGDTVSGHYEILLHEQKNIKFISDAYLAHSWENKYHTVSTGDAFVIWGDKFQRNEDIEMVNVTF